jgi:hypothetical protein
MVIRIQFQGRVIGLPVVKQYWAVNIAIIARFQMNEQVAYTPGKALDEFWNV